MKKSGIQKRRRKKKRHHDNEKPAAHLHWPPLPDNKLMPIGIAGSGQMSAQLSVEKEAPGTLYTECEQVEGKSYKSY